MIDLHLHTTASDGRCTPDQLVRRVAAAGVRRQRGDRPRHGRRPAAATRRPRGARRAVVAGIEITAVYGGATCTCWGTSSTRSTRSSSSSSPRSARIAGAASMEMARPPGDARRRRSTCTRLLEAGARRRRARRSAGPRWRSALVATGTPATRAMRSIASWRRAGPRSCRAAAPRRPRSIALDRAARAASSSLAHPGKLGLDDLLAPLAGAGLDAIEVYHTDHDAADGRRSTRAGAHAGPRGVGRIRLSRPAQRPRRSARPGRAAATPSMT